MNCLCRVLFAGGANPCTQMCNRVPLAERSQAEASGGAEGAPPVTGPIGGDSPPDTRSFAPAQEPGGKRPIVKDV